MLRLCVFFICFVFAVKSQAIPLDLLLGDQDPVYIKAYHQRQHAWFKKVVFDFTPCLGRDTSAALDAVINETASWGVRLDPSAELIHNVEYYYTKLPSEESLIYGMRIHIPAERLYLFKKFFLNKKNDDLSWGLHVSSSIKGVCKVQPLFLNKGPEVEIFENDGSSKIKVIYFSKKHEPQKKYPFQPVIRSAIPIVGDKKERSEILFLDSFNLVFLSSEIILPAVRHEKEFHQLALRLIWNNNNDYTVFYP